MAVALVLAALAWVLMVGRQLGAGHDLPMQVDELFFATCSARGVALREGPMAGCHDNKAPLIFFVYHAVMTLDKPYDLDRLKVAANLLGLLVAGVAALLAGRLAGARSGALSFAIVLSIYVIAPSLSALKTEMLGLLFLLLALLVLGRFLSMPSWPAAMCAGTLLGLSLLSKQTYVFAMIAVMVGMLVCLRARNDVSLRQYATWFGALGVGVAVPFLLVFLFYFVNGLHIEFLASTFLYPAIYGGAQQASALTRAAWRAGLIAELVQPLLFLSVLGVASVAAPLLQGRGSENQARQKADLSLVVASATLGLLVMVVISPVLFRYHFLPIWVLMAVLVGVFAFKLIDACSSNGHIAAAVSLTVPAFFGVLFLNSWYSPTSFSKEMEFYRFEKIDAQPGEFAYVVGTWPEFFSTNGLIPASQVMYPSALHGAPRSWAYIPPDPSSYKAVVLGRLRDHNRVRLLEDFKRTPPRFIHVVDAMGKSPNTEGASDIKEIADYVRAHCVVLRRVQGRDLHAGTTYSCA